MADPSPQFISGAHDHQLIVWSADVALAWFTAMDGPIKWGILDSHQIKNCSWTEVHYQNKLIMDYIKN